MDRKEPRLSRLAVAGLAGFPVGLIFILIWVISEEFFGASLCIAGYFGLVGVVIWIAGCVLSVAAYIRIAANPDKLEGRWHALAGIILPLAVILYFLFYTPRPEKATPPPRPEQQPANSSSTGG